MTGISAMNDEDVKILIVDDQPRNLDALEVMLEPLGCTLVRAHSADEALLAMLREDFGALILDIRMPDMSGIELATLVKQRNRTRDVPILFLTAHVSEEEEVLEAYGVGGVDYLSKPIRADVLRSKVAVFAELHQKTRALVALNEELKHQVAERERAEVTLQQINVDLELRVAQRTEALARANQRARDNEERLRLAIDMAGIAPWELDVTAARPEPGSASPSRWSWNMRMPLQRWTSALEELWGLDPGSVGPMRTCTSACTRRIGRRSKRSGKPRWPKGGPSRWSSGLSRARGPPAGSTRRVSLCTTRPASPLA